MKRLIPVVELLRVSTQGQAAEDRLSLAAQHSTNIRTAGLHGLEIIETIEVVESGAAVARGPAMKRLLAIASGGRAQGILLAEFSRLFRPEDWRDYAILQTLAEAGAKIYEPSGAIDLESDSGALQAAIMSAFAARERRQIKARMARGKEEGRRQGKHVEGALGLPMGVSYAKLGGWRYTEEIEVVREVFRRFIGGERNFERLGASLGLGRTTARSILTNPTYCGWRIYKNKVGRDGRKVPRSADDVLRVRLLSLEPIVSEVEFEMVQRIIAEAKACRAPRRSLHEAFLYRGMLECAEDGLPIYTRTGARPRGGGDPQFMYVCRAHVPGRRPEGMEKCGTGCLSRNRLEPLLDETITGQLSNPHLIVGAIGAQRRGAQADSADRAMEVASQRLERAAVKRERVLDAFIDGNITREEKGRRLAVVEAEIAAATEALALAAPSGSAEVSEEDILAIVTAFAEWRFLPRPQRRRILEAMSPTFTICRLGARGRFGVVGVRLPLLGDEVDSSGLHTGSTVTQLEPGDGAMHSHARGRMFYRRRRGLFIPLLAA
jgi:DNA invertase Pin-like site-specific DNA recombinase